MSVSQNIMDRTEQVVLHTYNRFPVVFEKGEGVCLTDADGKEYLDFGAGIAVFALGYGNKSYNDALKNQIDKLIHTSNLYYHKPLCEAAEKILRADRNPMCWQVRRISPSPDRYSLCFCTGL